MKQHDKRNQNATGSNKPKLEIPSKPTPPVPQSEPVMTQCLVRFFEFFFAYGSICLRVNELFFWR